MKKNLAPRATIPSSLPEPVSGMRARSSASDALHAFLVEVLSRRGEWRIRGVSPRDAEDLVHNALADGPGGTAPRIPWYVEMNVSSSTTRTAGKAGSGGLGGDPDSLAQRGKDGHNSTVVNLSTG